MRLLIIVPSLLRAGAETQAVDLANGLVERGHEVHFCCFESALDQRVRLDAKVQFHHFLRRSKYDLSVVTSLAALIDVAEIDVIQAVMEISALFGWLARARSRLRPALVCEVHTTISRTRKDDWIARLLYRRLLRRCRDVIFVCSYQKEYWTRRFPELGPLAKVIYNGVDPSRFRRADHLSDGAVLRSRLGIPESAFVFSAVAAFRPEKGHAILVDAFSRLSGDPFLVCAGDGMKRHEIEARVRSIGVESRVRFLGVVPDSRPVIAASDATILASTAVETFSMAMLESMCMGVPMVAPALGGLPEAIQSGHNGLLFPTGDTDRLAVAMQLLVDDRLLAGRLGAQAEHTVQSRFGCDAMVSGYERVLGDNRIR